MTPTIRTKADLLRAMEAYGACDGAFRYVAAHAADDARTIGLTCRRRDWLVWFLSKHGANRTPTFERVGWEAVDRAVRLYLPQILTLRGLEHCTGPLTQLDPVHDQSTGWAAFDWLCALEGRLYESAFVRTLCEVREVRKTLQNAAQNPPELGLVLDYVMGTASACDQCGTEFSLQLSALHVLWEEVTSAPV